MSSRKSERNGGNYTSHTICWHRTDKGTGATVIAARRTSHGVNLGRLQLCKEINLTAAEDNSLHSSTKQAKAWTYEVAACSTACAAPMCTILVATVRRVHARSPMAQGRLQLTTGTLPEVRVAGSARGQIDCANTSSSRPG
jgi:hypothetical protein